MTSFRVRLCSSTLSSLKFSNLLTSSFLLEKTSNVSSRFPIDRQFPCLAALRMIFSIIEKNACLPTIPPGRLKSIFLISSNSPNATSSLTAVILPLSSISTTGFPSNRVLNFKTMSLSGTLFESC